MKRLGFSGRRAVLAVLAALVLFPTLPANAAPAGGKRVDVTVEVRGNLEGVDPAAVEDIAEDLFEAASFAVTDEDGPDIVEFHVVIEIDDDQEGFTIHFEAGAWSDDVDIDSMDDFDDVFTVAISEYSEEAGDDDDDDPEMR